MSKVCYDDVELVNNNIIILYVQMLFPIMHIYHNITWIKGNWGYVKDYYYL